MNPNVFRLEGRSRIVDSDGELRAALGDEEGVITADVVLDPSPKRRIARRRATAAGCIPVRKLRAG
jgi:predicted amidohydrolase